jgi:hypothetical protein
MLNSESALSTVMLKDNSESALSTVMDPVWNIEEGSYTISNATRKLY